MAGTAQAGEEADESAASECSCSQEGSGDAGSFASDTSIPECLDDGLVACAAGQDAGAKRRLYLSRAAVEELPPVSAQLQSLLAIHSPDIALSSGSTASEGSGCEDGPGELVGLQVSMPVISSQEPSTDDSSLSFGSNESVRSPSTHNMGSGGDSVGGILPRAASAGAARAGGTVMPTKQSTHISISSPADCFFTLPLVI
jgi:hypothetical protein